MLGFQKSEIAERGEYQSKCYLSKAIALIATALGWVWIVCNQEVKEGRGVEEGLQRWVEIARVTHVVHARAGGPLLTVTDRDSIGSKKYDLQEN